MRQLPHPPCLSFGKRHTRLYHPELIQSPIRRQRLKAEQNFSIEKSVDVMRVGGRRGVCSCVRSVKGKGVDYDR